MTSERIPSAGRHSESPKDDPSSGGGFKRLAWVEQQLERGVYQPPDDRGDSAHRTAIEEEFEETLDRFKREKAREARRERWEWLAGTALQVIGGVLLLVIALVVFLGCLIFAFQNPGGRPPWAPR